MSKKDVSTEIAAKPEAPVPVPVQEVWGAAADFDAKDLVLSKILIVQKMSEILDTDPTARPGQFRDSLEGKLLAAEGAGLDVVVFYHTKKWVVNELVNGKPKFKRFEDYTVENASRSLAEGNLVYDECHDFYCLLVQEDAATSFPYVASMQRTSRQAAKRLQTVFLKMARAGKSSADVVVHLTADPRENEHGKFWVSDFSLGEATPAAHLEAAKGWYETLKKAKTVKVHEETEESENPAEF